MVRFAAWVGLALAGCSAPASNVPPPTAPEAADTGARLYDANCLPCHQPDARGIAGVYPSLVGSAVVNGDAQALVRWVVQGRRPPTMPAGRYPTAMAQFGWLTPADAAALLTYLRSHFGNAAPGIDADAVARALGP